MPTSLIIVDDFLDNAQEVREAGLRLHYPAARGNFPGRNSAQAVDLGVDEEVSRLVGEPLVPAPGHSLDESRWELTMRVPMRCSLPFNRYREIRSERYRKAGAESARNLQGGRAGQERRDLHAHL